MMGNKIILHRSVDDEEFIPAFVHADYPDCSGEGTLCGYKYEDICWNGNETRRGLVVYTKTDRPINCPHCLHILEGVHNNYTKDQEGKWR